MRRDIEELLQTDYWVIDVLPKQVPAGSAGQYFAVEEFFLRGEWLGEIKRRHAGVILKLNCYRGVSLDEDPAVDPPPEQIAEAVRTRHVCVMIGDSMILSEPDDTCLTLYDPDEELLELVRAIAAGEGLFVWRPGETGT